MEDNRKNLKIQALLEKISNMTAQYEDQVADLRVELTVMAQEKDRLQLQLDSLSTQEDSTTDEVVHEITEVPSSDSN